jgi:hypothetical protein
MNTTVFDEIINAVSSKYDAFTVEERENKIVYTLVSNDRSDFSLIKTNLTAYVGDTVYLQGTDPYSVSVVDDLGLYRIVFEKR